MSITYDYRVNITGQSLGSVVNTASTSVSLSALDAGANYEFRVRQRQLDSGVLYLSPWVLGTFQTAAAAQPVVVNLGSISHSVTLNAVTAFVADPPPVSVITYDLLVEQVGTGTSRVTGLTGTTHTLTGLTTSDEYNVSARSVSTLDGVTYYSAWSTPVNFTAGVAGPDPIIVNLGLISHSITLNDVTPIIVIPEPTSATTYSLRVERVGVTTTFVNNIEPTNYQLTGLVDGSEYNVSVRQYKDLDGAQYYTPWSQPVNFIAELDLSVFVNLGLITHSVTLNDVLATLGAFDVSSFIYENIEGQPFRVFGTTTKNIQSMTVTINGSPMSVTFNGMNWEAILLSGALQISRMEELDGLQTLEINNQLLEFV